MTLSSKLGCWCADVGCSAVGCSIDRPTIFSAEPCHRPKSAVRPDPPVRCLPGLSSCLLLLCTRRPGCLPPLHIAHLLPQGQAKDPKVLRGLFYLAEVYLGRGSAGTPTLFDPALAKGRKAEAEAASKVRRCDEGGTCDITPVSKHNMFAPRQCCCMKVQVCRRPGLGVCHIC